MVRIKKRDTVSGVRLFVSKSGKMGGWAPPGAQIGRIPGRVPDRRLPQGTIFEVIDKPKRIGNLNMAKVSVSHDPSRQTKLDEVGYAFWCDLWITCEIV